MSKEKAVAKLDEELQKAKDKTFAEPILSYLIRRCEEDTGLCEDVCQEHKTWEKCFKYVYDQAKNYAKGKNQCAVRDEVVYEWAEDYYHKDDKAEEEEKARKEAERKQKEAERKGNKTFEDSATKKYKAEAKARRESTDKQVVKKKEQKPIKKGKECEGQLDLFSLMGM